MLDTKNTTTWCPGCPNYIIKEAVKRAIKGYKESDIVTVADIGCNGKIYDYLNVSGFCGLHGRAIPTAIGVKVGNPKLKVLCFSGDGGAYNEGVEHFVHACRYNSDITLIVHNNQMFSLTAGQSTATTEAGFVDKTHPFGIKEKPLNPILLALTLGATFVARVSALDLKEMTRVISEGIKHKGFSFIEILQPCITFHNSSEYLRKNAYIIKPMSLDKAMKEASKWNYSHERGKIATGIFYKSKETTFEEKYLVGRKY